MDFRDNTWLQNELEITMGDHKVECIKKHSREYCYGISLVSSKLNLCYNLQCGVSTRLNGICNAIRHIQRYNDLYKMLNTGNFMYDIPDSKIHGANMGTTWVLSAPDGPHVGPMNLAIRDTWHSDIPSSILLTGNLVFSPTFTLNTIVSWVKMHPHKTTECNYPCPEFNGRLVEAIYSLGQGYSFIQLTVCGMDYVCF